MRFVCIKHHLKYVCANPHLISFLSRNLGAFNLEVCKQINEISSLPEFSFSRFPFTFLSFICGATFQFQPPRSVLQGSIKKKIESFRRWSSASIKRPPKTKAKTLSLSSPVGDPEDLWLQEGDRRKLRPIVDSVFGQVGF